MRASELNDPFGMADFPGSEPLQWVLYRYPLRVSPIIDVAYRGSFCGGRFNWILQNVLDLQ
jgi:hypothetical protein